MKKFFTLLFALLSITAVNAQTKLTLGGKSANGNWSWGTNQSIGASVALCFGSQWGEYTLASSVGDAVKVKLTVAEANDKINLVIKHNAADAQYIAVSATEMIEDLSDVSLIELQGTEAGAELNVVSCVLISAEGTETQTTYATNWGVSSYGGTFTSTDQWAQIMLNGAEQTEPQKITVNANAAIPEGIQLKVIDVDGTEHYEALAAGGTKAEAVLDYGVKEASIQFTAVGLVLDINYVTTEPYGSTGIATVAATNPSDKAYKAVKNGKVVIVKNGAEYNVAGQLVK